MKGQIRTIKVTGFRSLADVTVPLGRLTVLVGPNGSGKTNVLNVLRLLGSTIRFDLPRAIADFGGFDHVLRADGKTTTVQIQVEALVTAHASDRAPDRYTLSVSQALSGALRRREEFKFKRVSGRGRRITVNGSTITIDRRRVELADDQATGLSTLPRLAQGSEGIEEFADFISAIRVLEPDVAAARAPSRLYKASLAEDASNVADALFRLREVDGQAFQDLQRDLQHCLPGLTALTFSTPGGAARNVVIQLKEKGLSAPVDLADASFGTVRLLTLLVALHEPDPPPFTAIEEIDHGLHPYALDVVVDALRAASERTQLLVATHSPTFVNRLAPDELVVCDRDADSGASIIPAVTTKVITEAVKKSDLRLGELWFSGAVGGVPAS